VEAPGTQDDRLAPPERSFLNDSPRHVLLQHGSGTTFCGHATDLQGMHRIAHEILRLGGSLEREDPCHSRYLTNVQHPHAGIVGRCNTGNESQGRLARFKLINRKQQSVPHRHTSSAASILPDTSETEYEQASFPN
jgi:hypothetical protein